MRFADRFPGSRLHVYGRTKDPDSGYGTLWSMLRGKGIMGEMPGWVTNLHEVYRAADLMITPTKIATRAVREAMASGCQVVTGADADIDDPVAFAEKMKKRLEFPQPVSGLARALFSPERTAREFLAVINHCVEVPQGV